MEADNFQLLKQIVKSAQFRKLPLPFNPSLQKSFFN
jgi:hypothetical protein